MFGINVHVHVQHQATCGRSPVIQCIKIRPKVNFNARDANVCFPRTCVARTRPAATLQCDTTKVFKQKFRDIATLVPLYIMM